jgi:putative lumazine-binding protein
LAEIEGAISPEDREMVVASAKDYIQGWLDGDADRMTRCLHPELAKRSVRPDPATGGCLVRTLTREDMVAATGTGEGAEDAGPYEIEILDAYGNTATVKVLSASYIDYLQHGRCGNAWPILNVLWQRRIGR